MSHRLVWNAAWASFAAVMVTAVAGAQTVTPLPAWPADAAWTALTRSGQPLTDLPLDGPGSGGGYRELVGDPEPVLYVHSDGVHLFFRMRLDISPVKSEGDYEPFGWGCEIGTSPTDTTSYQYLVMMNGIVNNGPFPRDGVQLLRNTVMSSPNDPKDAADSPPIVVYPAWSTTIANQSGFARTVPASTSTNGTQDVFLDFAVLLSDLRADGVTATTPLRFTCGSSNNAQNIAGDLVSSTSQTTLSAIVSDSYVCDATGCRSCSTATACGTSCAACTGGTPSCTGAGGSCVECLDNGDCTTASEPRCDTTTNTCAPCNADGALGGCTNPTKPACQATGPLAGQCTACSATNTVRCSGDTPFCDTATGSCVSCRSNADCSGTTPRCNLATHTCVACNGDGAAGGCTDPTKPACQTSGPLAGSCTQCTTGNTSQCGGATPSCSASGTCASCTTSAQCSGTTPVCNTGTGVCGPCTGNGTAGGCTTQKPACQTSGPLSGACTQCSATNTTACTGATPVCNTTTGTCVGCLTNTQCPVTAPFCSPVTRTCGPCTGNGAAGGCADPTKPVCSTTGPLAGRCVECTTGSTAACTGAKPFCDVTAGTCVGCRTAADCTASKPVCDATTKTCKGCTADGPAGGCTSPTKPACITSGPLAGTCQTCSGTNTSRCTGNTPKCRTTTATCVQCLANTDCPSERPFCNPSTNICGGCTADGPAGGCTDPTRPACQTSGPLSGTCQECSATNASRCGGNEPSCVTAVGRCGCTSDGQCPAGERCEDPGPSPDGGVADAGDAGDAGDADASAVSSGVCKPLGCASNADCPTEPNRTCDTSVSPSQCVECLTDAACSGGRVCDVAARTCRECTATQTQNCSEAGKGRVCLITGTCGCRTDADCGAPASGRTCDTTRFVCTPEAGQDGGTTAGTSSGSTAGTTAGSTAGTTTGGSDAAADGSGDTIAGGGLGCSTSTNGGSTGGSIDLRALGGLFLIALTAVARRRRKGSDPESHPEIR